MKIVQSGLHSSETCRSKIPARKLVGRDFVTAKRIGMCEKIEIVARKLAQVSDAKHLSPLRRNRLQLLQYRELGD
jgi:hypothetical protein